MNNKNLQQAITDLAIDVPVYAFEANDNGSSYTLRLYGGHTETWTPEQPTEKKLGPTVATQTAPTGPNTDQLTDVAGIGPATAAALGNAGVHTVRDLALALQDPTEDLTRLHGVNRGTVAKAEAWLRKRGHLLPF